ncbi:MAG TPA: hypothetical protein VHG28_12545 [Longimicrobiaceae bacterium]|nr:hypothetical protein [Longimicrobiaceae bacterium]
MLHRSLGTALAVATFATAGCDNFLEVENPAVVEASTVDPVADAPVFSLSAQTDMWEAYDDVAVYGGWFSGEIWVDDTFPTRNDIAKRVIDPRNNGTLNTELYTPLQRAIAGNHRVLRLLAGTASENSIHAQRAAMNLGFSLALLAETFCQGVISQGAQQLGTPLTPAQTLDSAVVYFQRAINMRGQITGTDTVEAKNNLYASRIGLARAYLQKGDNQNAAAAAQAALTSGAPASFEYRALKVDDPSNRTRLGNTQYYFTVLRPNLVAPPYLRALNDPRIGSTRTGQPPTGQGGQLVFWAQTKFPNWNSPVRIASLLEARYIQAEAQLKLGNPAPATTLIAERRAAGSTVEGDDFATGNPTLIQLMDQLTRDFWMEAKHLPAWRRNSNETPYAPRAGTPYYISVFGGPYGNQTCMPLPVAETDNNPNFPRA